MCDAGCAKKLLILCNFIVWLGGAGLLGIGLWMKLDPTMVHYFHVVNIHQVEPLIDHAALIFIIVGALAFVVGVIGCVGAIRDSQSLLFLYAALLLVIMAAELTGGILALIYRMQVMHSLHLSMYAQVMKMYSRDPDTTDAWDFLQPELSCCGSQNYTDWMGSYWWNNTKNGTDVFPDSCCSGDIAQCQEDAATGAPNSDTFFKMGCYHAMIMWFHQHSMIMMIIGFAVGGCQVFGFIAACCLRSALKNKPYTA